MTIRPLVRVRDTFGDFTSRDSHSASTPGADLDDDVTSHGNRLILLERNNRKEKSVPHFGKEHHLSRVFIDETFIIRHADFNTLMDETMMRELSNMLRIITLKYKLVIAYSQFSSDSIVLHEILTHSIYRIRRILVIQR